MYNSLESENLVGLKFHRFFFLINNLYTVVPPL